VKPSADLVIGICPQVRASPPTLTVLPSKLKHPQPLIVALVR
jgi:hypothetical protein